MRVRRSHLMTPPTLCQVQAMPWKWGQISNPATNGRGTQQVYKVRKVTIQPSQKGCIPKDVGSFPDENKGATGTGVCGNKGPEAGKGRCPPGAGAVPLAPPNVALHVLPSCRLHGWEVPGSCSAVGVRARKRQ